MLIYNHEELCEIVEEFVKNFMRWEGYVPQAIEDIWESFKEDEEYTKVKFQRRMKVREINVKDLDDNGTL